MGYSVEYKLRLKIKAANIPKALEIMNHLHSDEMLLEHANGGMYGADVDKLPICKKKWYRWVTNPEKPYETIEEAFQNWRIVEENISMGRFGDISLDRDGTFRRWYKPDGDFILEGSYNSKIGQQDFLLKQLAPVLENMRVHIVGEDDTHFVWTIEKGVFREEQWRPSYFNEEDSDDE